VGFIADLFLEFHAGCIAAAYLIGHLYSLAWQRSRVRRGLWTILYFEMLILSIYLPTQSIGAWLYRLLILAVPTLLLMGYLAPRLASRRRAPAIRTWMPSPA
jgi:hypothetical protein